MLHHPPLPLLLPPLLLPLPPQSRPGLVLAHLDLVFKWLTLRLCERESVPVLKRLLAFTAALFKHLVARGYALSDAEAAVALPYLCEKSGNSKQRFRDMFREVKKSAGKERRA